MARIGQSLSPAPESGRENTEQEQSYLLSPATQLHDSNRPEHIEAHQPVIPGGRPHHTRPEAIEILDSAHSDLGGFLRLLQAIGRITFSHQLTLNNGTKLRCNFSLTFLQHSWENFYLALAEIIPMLSYALAMFALFLSATIGSVLSAKISTDSTGLSDSSHCGIYDLPDGFLRLGGHINQSTSFPFQVEAEAGEYAKRCYSYRSFPAADGCNFFHSQHYVLRRA